MTWNHQFRRTHDYRQMQTGALGLQTAGSTKWAQSPQLRPYLEAWRRHGSTERRSPDFGRQKMKFRILNPNLLRTRRERISDACPVWSRRSPSHCQFIFKNLAQDMPSQYVCLLDSRRVCGGNFK